VRANSRPVNKGLRLDYFMCSKSLFAVQQMGRTEEDAKGAAEEREGGTARNVDDVPSPGVVDSFILHEDTVGVSDHCPIMLVMKL
jgi:exonuclease III